MVSFGVGSVELSYVGQHNDLYNRQLKSCLSREINFPFPVIMWAPSGLLRAIMAARGRMVFVSSQCLYFYCRGFWSHSAVYIAK